MFLNCSISLTSVILIRFHNNCDKFVFVKGLYDFFKGGRPPVLYSVCLHWPRTSKRTNKQVKGAIRSIKYPIKITIRQARGLKR